MSPIYPKLKEAGAVFEQVMGYERPTWFEPELARGLLLIFTLHFIKNKICMLNLLIF